jgi:hypothetical protein
MNKIVKLTSLQSGNFTAEKNLIDFDLPSGKQYDLRNAYINLVGAVSQTEITPTAFPAVYNWAMDWSVDGTTTTNITFPNCALVKNARMTSSKHGLLEDLRRVDVLRTQLKQYTQSEDDYRGTLYNSLSQPTNFNNIRLAPNIEFKSTGTQISRLNDVNVQIPLKDIYELGNTDNLPCDKLGNVRLHLEMNLDKLKIVQVQGAGTRATEFGRVEYTTFQDTAAGDGASTITTTEPFVDIANSPFWVGQKLSFDASGNGGAADISGFQRTITGIAQNEDQTLDLLLSEELVVPPTAGHFLSNLTCDGVDFDSMSITWTDAELVVEEKGKNDPVGQLDYFTYTNEEDNGAGLLNFSRQYGAEQGCFNLLVCPVDASSNLLVVNNNRTRYESYRLRVDNKDLTNRVVEERSPLYYDRVGMYLLNQNLPLKNLIEVNTRNASSYADRYAAPNHELIFIGTPLPMTPMRKQVQITLNCGAGTEGVRELQLYKSVMRSIKL